MLLIAVHGRVVRNASCAAVISDRRVTGLSADVIAEPVAELGPLWRERHRARLVPGPRKRALGTAAKHPLLFVDRLLAILVHLRYGATHGVLACWFDVDRSTITRAIGEVRPLPAERGGSCGPRPSVADSGRGRRPPRCRREDRDRRRHREPRPAACRRAQGPASST
ncbi:MULTISPECIES: transposase family protein [unclassified Streptomyces]|uniref:helix-turn-helix domain-containing protein n=1 Tax=unclassified Streptomyces TaxID=2593676 RepID=UPI0036FE4A9B